MSEVDGLKGEHSGAENQAVGGGVGVAVLVDTEVIEADEAQLPVDAPLGGILGKVDVVLAELSADEAPAVGIAGAEA